MKCLPAAAPLKMYNSKRELDGIWQVARHPKGTAATEVEPLSLRSDVYMTSGSTYSPRLRLDPTRLAGPNPKVFGSCTSKGELGLASHALLTRRAPLHDAVTDLRGDVGDGPGAVREEDGLCL
jgi:hypothetical protein